MKLNKWLLVTASFAVIAAFFILREHWDHALGLAPYLILLACPLLHLFHPHGAHGGDTRKIDEKTHH